MKIALQQNDRPAVTSLLAEIDSLEKANGKSILMYDERLLLFALLDRWTDLLETAANKPAYKYPGVDLGQRITDGDAEPFSIFGLDQYKKQNSILGITERPGSFVIYDLFTEARKRLTYSALPQADREAIDMLLYAAFMNNPLGSYSPFVETFPIRRSYGRRYSSMKSSARHWHKSNKRHPLAPVFARLYVFDRTFMRANRGLSCNLGYDQFYLPKGLALGGRWLHGFSVNLIEGYGSGGIFSFGIKGGFARTQKTENVKGAEVPHGVLLFGGSYGASYGRVFYSKRGFGKYGLKLGVEGFEAGVQPTDSAKVRYPDRLESKGFSLRLIGFRDFPIFRNVAAPAFYSPMSYNCLSLRVSPYLFASPARSEAVSRKLVASVGLTLELLTELRFERIH